jgi:hypothetical protein
MYIKWVYTALNHQKLNIYIYTYIIHTYIYLYIYVYIIYIYVINIIYIYILVDGDLMIFDGYIMELIYSPQKTPDISHGGCGG